jgi:8-oxo-dGTP pyrophosphatase MutT (NUDIX family)
MKSDTTRTTVTTRSDLQRYPSDAFRFCPRCGSESLATEEHRAVKCGICGFLYFFNSAAASGAFVFHQGRLILCVRAKEPGKGKLDVPGGFVEYDESVEEALRREIAEELGIETSHYHYLASAPNDYLYAGVLYKLTDLFFVCEAPDIGGIQAADDVADFLIVPPGEVDPELFAFNSTRTAFEKLEVWLRQKKE